MGDMADWTIDQGMGYCAQEIESRSRARALSNAEIVNALISYEDCDDNILDADFAEKVRDICKWYQEKNFLTKKQRNCLNAAFTELDIRL
jgi:hypothetical protein